MMPFARTPKRSEENVSAASQAAGEQQMISAMRALPLSVSCKVNSLKSVWLMIDQGVPPTPLGRPIIQVGTQRMHNYKMPASTCT